MLEHEYVVAEEILCTPSLSLSLYLCLYHQHTSVDLELDLELERRVPGEESNTLLLSVFLSLPLHLVLHHYSLTYVSTCSLVPRYYRYHLDTVLALVLALVLVVRTSLY
jgi:hypothetical protein